MGSLTSIEVSKDHIDQSLLCQCKVGLKDGNVYSLVEVKDSILLLSNKELHFKEKLDERIKFKDYFEIKLETIYCIKKRREFRNSVFIGYSDGKNIKSLILYFETEEEFLIFWNKYGNLCRSHRNGRPRNLAILINPISGKKKSLEYFEKYLKPMLEVCEITYTCRCTSSADYIDEWVETLDLEETPYTDFIMIGGDGILNQFINAVAKRDDKEELFRIPIGILPGGSTNATACDLSGKNPVIAATNVCKGDTIEGDIMKVTLKNQKKSMYTTTVTWGAFADIVHDSEGWRNWFGSWRYQVCGFRHVFCKCSFKTYKAEIMFKNEEAKEENSAQVGESVNQERPETDEPFEKYGKDDFTFFSIVSHECRSSNDKSILAPFARYSDQKLNFVSLNPKTRFGMVYFMSKVVAKGEHIKLKSFECKRATEAIIKPISDSYFNIDGEIFGNDEAHIKIIPRFLNLIGKIYEKTDDQQKYTEKLESET